MRIPGRLVATDTEARTITGTLLPWGVEGNTSRGPVSFAPGSVTTPDDPAAVLLNREHDPLARVGRLVAAADDGTGLVTTWRIARTPAGDAALAEAAEGMRTGLSVEADQLDLDGAVIRGARLIGGALVATPAFVGAHVVEIAAAEWPTVETAPVSAPAPAQPVPAQPVAPEPAPVLASGPAYGTPMHQPARTAPRPANLVDLYAMLVAAHTGRATPEITAALSDVTWSANTATAPSQYADELWSHVVYQRQIIPAIGGADLTSYTVTGWKWNVRPAVAAWAGDKAAVPSNAPTTTAVSKSASRLAGAHDIDRKFRDFGDSSYFASYYAAMTESYAQLSDAACLADLQAAAAVVTPTAGQLVANMNALYNAVRAYGPTTIFVGFGVYDALAAITAASVPGGLVPIGWRDLITPTPLLAAADALAVCRPAATFYELSGSPIRVEAVDMVKGGIDPGVFGYYATLVNQPLGLAKVTGATTLEAGVTYPDPPVVMEASPDATETPTTPPAANGK